MRAIAAEAGVSVETVNGHGPKGDLLFAAFELAFAGREGEAPFSETEEARPALAPPGAGEFVAAGVHVLSPGQKVTVWQEKTSALPPVATQDPGKPALGTAQAATLSTTR